MIQKINVQRIKNLENQCIHCRKLRSSIHLPNPVPNLIWSWLLWFHLMCKSSFVYFTCLIFEVGWCVCVCVLYVYSVYIMIQFDTIILTILSSNIMTNFVYFIGFCLLNTPFDFAHIVLKYTKCCIHHIWWWCYTTE